MKDRARILIAIVSGLLLLAAGIVPVDANAKWERRFPDVVVYTAPEPLPPEARLSDGRYTPIPLWTHTLVTWIDPMDAHRTPSTPPSAQLGTMPGGGGSGYRQR